MIIGQPVILTNSRKMMIAMAISVPYDKVDDYLSKVCYVNAQERIKLVNYGDYHCFTVAMWDSVEKNGFLYIPLFYSERMNSELGEYTIPAIMAIWILSKVAQNEDILNYHNNINKQTIRYFKDLIKIAEEQSKIRDRQKILESYYENLSFLKLPDWTAFVKAAKKYKVKAVHKDGYISLMFPNVICGNDIEGFIQYRAIEVLWSKNTNSVKEVIYYFKDFIISDKWGFITALHPHVDGSFCWGNREEDYSIYRNANEWGFLIGLINESLRGYNPSSPFINITKLRHILSQLKAVLPKDVTKLRIIRNDVAESFKWFSTIKEKAQSCPICGQILMEGQPCMGQNCRRNPDSIIDCDICGQQYIWDMVSRELRCPGHYLCGGCGSISAGNTCVNPNCSTNIEVSSE